MLRVVHVVVAGEIGGAERMLLDLASRPSMSHAEHSVALMTPNDGLARMLRGAGLRVIDRGRVHENPVAYVWRTLGPLDAAWLRDTLRREQADVVHLHTFGSQVIGTRAALEYGARIVRTEHSTRVYKDPTCWPFARWSLARADAIVAVSEHVRHIAIEKAAWVAPKVRVVYSGVDTKHFAPPKSDGDRAAREPKGSPFTFVISGRLEPRKGIDIALGALAQVEGARLSVLGDGVERGRLEARARATGVAGRVQFHGYVRDPRDVLATAGAILCSSREEGLGIALLEAMAMGRPVVTVPVGGVPEIVKDGGTGWIARESTAESLAERMREAMRDPARLVAMGKAARAFVEKTCSLEQMCEGYGDVYRELSRARTG